MLEYLRTSQSQLIIGLSILAVLCIVGYYVVLRFRGKTGEDASSTNELLTNFREMNQEGDISDAEYRTIKSVLGEQLQEELNDTDDKG